MSRQDITLSSETDRLKAVGWIMRAPLGFIITITDAMRTNEQNKLLWPLLGEISRAVTWQDLLGRPKRLTTHQWKIFFLDMLNQEAVNVPNADGTGYVNVGRSSSALSKSEFSNLLELIYQFGAERGVTFHDTTGKAA